MQNEQIPLSARTTLSKADLIDRVQGCIFGAALGDAFGLSTEFMTKANARHLYGVGPIKFGKADGFEFWRDGHRSRWSENDFTDDTDQLLLILQCLLANNGTLDSKHFAFRLREWTQIGFPELEKPPCGIGFTVGSVINSPDFLTAPLTASYNVWNGNKRNLAANGAVMRTSVLGIPFFWDEAKVAENALRAAKVTHADPRSVISALVVSVIVSRMLRGGAQNSSDDQKIADHLRLSEISLLGTEFEQLGTATGEESVPIEPKSNIPEPSASRSSGIFEKLTNYFKKENRRSDGGRFKFPEFKTLDRERGEKAAIVPENLPKSMDDFGADAKMEELCRSVLEDYKFLLESNPFFNAETNPTWLQELDAHCFPNCLGDLALEEKQSMGYTYKCVGAGIYAFTRAQSPGESSAEFFKAIITQLTLEAGDADTNCAVAGALLGIRLGKRGLPADWLSGIRHANFLEKISLELCSLITELC